MDGYHAIETCRVSGTTDLLTVVDLGPQALTGVFPHRRDADVTSGPLQLAWCPTSGLLQLRHSFEPSEMYGENYGYRSGINGSMARHLAAKIHGLEARVGLREGDAVLDIGSNDATSLRAYRTAGLVRVGIDPTIVKFSAYYPDDIIQVPTFFSGDVYRSTGAPKPRVITSIAMFYDLDDPIAFARDIAETLAPDGVWHFEQSYMPTMLRSNAYDTICHEHLEYYSLAVVRDIVEAAGLEIVDVGLNAVNGGSFAVTAAHRSNRSIRRDSVVIQWLLEQERLMGLDTPRPFREFEERIYRHRNDLTRLVTSLVDSGKSVYGYGASTKGNVLLQFCGFTADVIPAIAEVNEEKFGCFTPGTGIPIASEDEVHAQRPDYLLVLPWHFREGILAREAAFRERGGKFIFPLPEIEIV
jgi:hypothetical protein